MNTPVQARPQSASATTREIDGFRALVRDDMAAVDALIRSSLHSEVVLINQLGQYIVGSGGKRLRPLLHLLCAQACGYSGRAHIDLAAVIEFIHTATLLHDDVVDDSDLRRGRETANAIWGNEASVLVGDFLYSRAFEMMVAVRDMRIMEIMSHTTNIIAEGEVMQLMNCHEPDTSEEKYLEVIRCKTAKLFEAAAQLGAVLAKADADTEQRLAAYGRHLGTAFQLIDDVLDYSADAGEIGKNIGDDLAEGKPTLPLIIAMRKGTPAEVQVVRHAIEHGGLDTLDQVVAAIESTDAITYTAALARNEAEMASAQLSTLRPSPYRDALYELADFAVHRTY